jgi:1-deoxy-D-xylulose-5-phosphate synthase
MSILKTIHGPDDLKRLPPEQFPALCQELREQIIGVVSNVGGHLASNLGVIELTVALHYLLNPPKDKIVCAQTPHWAAGTVPHASTVWGAEWIHEA